MEEKIGIEKLIELLNEYENKDFELEEGEESNARTENDGHLWFNGANKVQFDTYMFDSLALSKRYGFILWLVDNDKINEEKVKKEAEYYWTDEYDVYEGYVFYHRLLMLLSVSDTPIEFLISILK